LLKETERKKREMNKEREMEMGGVKGRRREERRREGGMRLYVPQLFSFKAVALTVMVTNTLSSVPPLLRASKRIMC
jgi:hypothetical protein